MEGQERFLCALGNDRGGEGVVSERCGVDKGSRHIYLLNRISLIR